MFAVVDIAGFQEKVSKGDKLNVPLLDVEEGKTTTFDNVLLIADGKDTVKIGKPAVEGASVEVKVLAHGKGPKLRTVKFKRRKRYTRVKNHRQQYTQIEVTGIKG